MRLSKDDKNEILKAAWVATKARDYEGFTDWLVQHVYAIDDLPEGKSDLAMTPYRPQTRPAPQTAPILPVPVDAPNGPAAQSLWPRGA